MNIEVFELTPGQWAYRVEGVFQEWHPDFEGFVNMTKEQAETCAYAVAQIMQAG